MATSGTVTFGVSERDLITDALQTLGVIGAADAIQAEDLQLARRKLNLIVKQWVSQIDFSPGLKLFHRRTGYLILQDATTEYLLGPTGDHATESYSKTTLSASASAAAGTVTLTSVSGLASGMYIGVTLDSGAIDWTTINGAPAGQVVTLTATLDGAAAAGNAVYTYTTKVRRPFEILSASMRDENDRDRPIDISMSLEEYEAIGKKSDEGTPLRLYFEPQRLNAKVYLDCAPSRLDVLRYRYMSYPEDFTGTTQDADFPIEWARALSAQLAMDCAPAFKKPMTPELRMLRDESLKMAQNAYPETFSGAFMVEPDCY